MFPGEPQGTVLFSVSWTTWVVWSSIQITFSRTTSKYIDSKRIPLSQLVTQISVRVWCIASYMTIYVNKTRNMSFCRKTNWHVFFITNSRIFYHTQGLHLAVLIDTKLQFYQQVDNISSQAVRLLGLIRAVTFSLSPLHSLLTLYCTLLRPKLH